MAIASNSEKFEAIQGEFTNKADMTLQILNRPKSKLLKIKSGTANQSFIRGYIYSFRINAPKELIKIGYNSGFGEKNSIGLGYVS